jgi:DNA-directed RNA polymerase subunit K/omega
MAQSDEVQDQPAEATGAVSPPPPITSRFLFVDVAAQRAKQLRRGAIARLDRQASVGPHKLERVAMEEVRQQLIQYTLPTGYEGARGEKA